MNSARAKALAAAVGLAILAVIGVVWFRGQQPAPATAEPARDHGADRTTAEPTARAAAIGTPPEPEPSIARVSGHVRSRLDGAPVADVEVLFRAANGEATARSDAGGAYAIELEPGTWEMRAVGDQFISFGARALAIAGDAEGVDIGVLALAIVRGRVVDAGDHPAADVRVHHATTLLGQTLDSTATEPAGETATGADGSFELRVPPGAVELIAAPDAGPEARSLLPWVEPGAELGGVTLRLPTGVTVRGGVVDPTGRPVTGATIRVSADGDETRTATSADDGSFEVAALPSGELRIEATAEGHAPSPVAVLEVPDGASRAGLILRLGTAAIIAGRVLDHAGQPVAGATVTATRTASTLPPVTATTAGDGGFQIDDLGSGPFDLVARAAEHATARLPGVRAPAADLELRLGRFGAIAGTVTAGGEPVPVFTVAVRPNLGPGGSGGDRTELPEPVRYAGTGGDYRIDRLAPGRHDLVVSAPGHAPLVIVGVEVPPGGEAIADAALEPGARVTGRVTTEAGAPIGGATVQLSTGYEGDIAYTDRDGRYQVDDVAPGRRTVEVARPGYVARMVTGLVLEAGRAKTVDVTLARAEPGAGQPLELAGIGAALRIEEGRLLVVEPIPGGPSEGAGLLAEDEIVSIDGALASELTFPEIIELLRGVVGTSVRLAIRRGAEPVRMVDVVRQLFRVER